MPDSRETVHVTYRAAGVPGTASITFTNADGAEWRPTVANGESRGFDFVRAADTDAFDFVAVTFWAPRQPTTVPGHSFMGAHGQSAPPVAGVSVYDVDTQSRDALSFVVDNASTSTSSEVLSLEVTLRDTTANRGVTNPLFTSRDPQIGIEPKDG